MTPAQYAFCVLYASCSAALIGIVAMQQGSENNKMEALSGGVNESYYAKNMAHSAEAKKKRFTKALAVGFAVLTAASMFVLR